MSKNKLNFENLILVIGIGLIVYFILSGVRSAIIWTYELPWYFEWPVYFTVGFAVYKIGKRYDLL